MGRLTCLSRLPCHPWLGRAVVHVTRNLAEDLAAQVRPAALPALASLADRLAACTWDKAGIPAAL